MSSTSTQILEDLLDTLERRLDGGASTAAADKDAQGADARCTDAISAVLAGEPRSTSVVSLREAPAVQAFRQALTDGLIRVDTANRLLRLINEVIVRLVP